MQLPFAAVVDDALMARPRNELLTPAQRISWAIEQSGRAGYSIAESIGCSHVAVHKWASGETEAGHIKAALLQKFADETGVEVRWLLTGEGPARSGYSKDLRPLVLLAREISDLPSEYAERAERVLRALLPEQLNH